MSNNSDFNKTLIMVQSLNDISKLRGIYSDKVDILALSQNVMYILDEHQLRYMVFEDFYNEKDYIVDIDDFNKDVSIFFSRLDKECEVKSGFPYAYSGSEHYLLTWLDDLFYLEKFTKIIKYRYHKIYLLSEKFPQKLSKKLSPISKLNSNKVNGTISLSFERSVERKMQIIFNTIN